MSTKTALVIRATGAQGKGVTKHLLKSGWTVHALVNDPEHPRALALKDIGAKLFKGAINDPSSLEAAIQGCTAVFLNQWPSFTDTSEEARDAASILSIAKKAGIKHIVHATSLGLNEQDYRSKAAGTPVASAVLGMGDVEALVQQSGTSWTIVRPGYFMTNMIAPLSGFMFPELAEGKFVSCFELDTILPLVDPSDIGATVAAAMNDPPTFDGKIISIVSEKLTVAQIIKELSNAAGKKIEFVARPPEDQSILVAGETLSKRLHAYADMGEIKKLGIPLTSFRELLEEQTVGGEMVNQQEILKGIGAEQK